MLLISSNFRTKLPSSRAYVFSRIAPFDILWAGISPVASFLIRDGSSVRIEGLVIYSCIALAASLLVFQWFKISAPLAKFFSMRDASVIAGACLTVVALTTVIVFLVTRLDEAARAIPVIHFLMLMSGLVAVRLWGRLKASRTVPRYYESRSGEGETILIIGATRLAQFFSMMVEELCSNERRIVAILDERSELINRTLNGYSIVGLPQDLTKIIDEYATHGVEINKVVVAEHPGDLAERTRNDVRVACEAKNIQIEWLHQTFSVSRAKADEPLQSLAQKDNLTSSVAAGPYWKIKRLIDIAVALVLIIAVAPLTLAVAALVLIDVGFPVVFWQQRIGYRGRPFRVYKFRTMRSPFDRAGQAVPEAKRLSHLGGLLRRKHLDEIPQLFNILFGSMSLVGPRPLLPIDQSKDVRFRHQVRPGLTGLAQINGGTSLSADEKTAIDEWYIQRASLFLDIKILLRTIWIMVRGNQKNDAQILAALAEKKGDPSVEMGLGAMRCSVAPIAKSPPSAEDREITARAVLDQ